MARELTHFARRANESVWAADSDADWVQTAVEIFLREQARALKRQGRFCCAFSGGRSPIPFLQELARAKISTAAWQNSYFFQVDERVVPHHDPQNNFRMLEENFFSLVEIPPQNIFRMETENAAPPVLAQAYQDRLHQFFAPSQPAFDCIFLGMGEDGHTASLFPQSKVLAETQRWVVAAQPAQMKTARLTLTFPFLNAANYCTILAVSNGVFLLLNL
jgi:6-phosphogluconolactonase